MPPLTTNTKAILLLTAPLLAGPGTPTADLLTPGDYKALAQRLQEISRQPADLLGPDAGGVIEECRTVVEASRLQQLLARGLQLGQAVDRWKQRAIWVVSRADQEYPKRLKASLRGLAPAILYGCGEIGALNDGGLAVVGSRHVDEELVDYAREIGSLAARADRSIISGGAKGIDQAAMQGAIQAGGKACGVLADSLERQVMTREHRDMLMDGQLILVSPYDPNAGFNTGHAMQRNKVVYALADASLVVSSDFEKGGTWAGAMEQLKKLNLVRVYVRSNGASQRGLDGLSANGAISWPNPATPQDLLALLNASGEDPAEMQISLAPRPDANSTPAATFPAAPKNVASYDGADIVLETQEASAAVHTGGRPHAERLFDTARSSVVELAQQLIRDGEVAETLGVPKPLAKTWLERMVKDGVLQKTRRPAGYVVRASDLLEPRR